MNSVELSHQELLSRLAPLGVTEVRRLTGGASSLTYLAQIGSGRQVVVKVAPAGVPPVLHRDVLRQARILRALAPTAVPVPEVVWEDPGDPPKQPPLFVMDYVEGVSLEPLFDTGASPTDSGDTPVTAPARSAAGDSAPAVVAERMGQAARILAELHRLDPTAIGLGDEPTVTPTDEIARWSHLLETVEPPLAPQWQECARALTMSVPAPTAPAVVHGDFRLGNLLARGPRVTAVVDWEIWTVGDPRIDLGWFLINADHATYNRRSPYQDALPTPQDLLDIYGPAADVAWFEALACFKSTATWSLIVKHNRRRSTPDSDIEAMVPTLPRLLARAHTLLGRR